MDCIKDTVIKRAIKIFWRTLVATTTILFAGALIIQLPQVQTFVTNKIISSVSENFDGEIVFEKIHFKPFTTLVIKKLAIIDHNPVQDQVDSTNVKIDTLFRADYIIAKFTIDGLLADEGIHLDKAFVSNAQMTLVLERQVLDPSDLTEPPSNNLSRIFRLQKKAETSTNEEEIFRIKNVEVSNMGFAMKSYIPDRPERPSVGINWDDLDIKNINLKATELRFKGGVMSGSVEKLSFKEKSGYKVEKISGDAKVGNGKTIVENLHIDDLWSDVKLSLFMMSYENVSAFRDFLANVRIDGNIQPSLLNFETISYFAPSLKGNDLTAHVSGNMSGPVNNFRFTNVKINTINGGFSGTATGRMTGLPDITKTRLDAKLENFTVTSKGLSEFISQWIPGEKSLDFSKYAENIPFTLDVMGSGLMNRLTLHVKASSEIGGLRTRIRLDNVVDAKKPIGIRGSANTSNLDLGKILDNKLLGPITMRTTLSAQIGKDKRKSSIQIDSLKINRLHFNDYDYRNIAAVGSLNNESFDGRIISSDPNLNFMFQGSFALSSKTNNAKYKFYANVGHADLQALNIDKRGISRVSLMASADFTKTGHSGLKGKVDIGGLRLENSYGKENIGDITITSYSNDNTYTVRLDSKLANGKYTGSAPIGTFISDLRDVTLKKELPAVFADSTHRWKGHCYDLHFKSNYTMNLLSFLMPGLYIDEGTILNASLTSDGMFKAELSSNRLAFGKQYLKGVTASFDNNNNTLSGEVECNEIKVASKSITDNHLSLYANDNHIGLKYSFDNHSDLENRGEVIMTGNCSRNDKGPVFDLNLHQSAIFLNSKEWNILPSNIKLRADEMEIPSFAVVSGEEQIRINGTAAQNQKDTLTLSLDRFDVSIINSAMEESFGIKGAATGMVQITSPLKDKGILVDIVCDSTSIADVPLGELYLGSKWNDEDNTFLISAHNTLEGKQNLRLTGTLHPSSSMLNSSITLDGFKVDYAQPFLKTIFSTVNGELSGKIDIDGPLSRLSMRSTGTRLDKGMLKIDYTNVPYYADGEFHINETGVYFDDIKLRDRSNGTGVLGGSINWDHFKNIRFNTHVKVNGIEAIDLKEDTGKGFYGHIYGTGNVSISGPSNSLFLSVDAVTEKAGQLHIPLNETATAGKVTNLLRFKEKESTQKIDPYEQMMERLRKKEIANSDFKVKLRVNAQPEVEAYVEIDKETGNVLSGYGNGLIDIEANNDNFSINGDYSLSRGNYKFVAMGLVSRDFVIQNGSSIRFNGDIMDSNLNIEATYRTKASLSTLLSDASSVSTKRNVDCTIKITDKLSNPKIDFGISIPDLNPMIKSKVESALSTEDKVQKQFLSLIVSNNFLPDEQSGIVNNSSALYSNVTELFANQLNTIFQKLDIPIDLGLNYQPNEQGNDLFDVAVSTHLFNNRVVVNGNIGNKQHTTGGTQNEVVGDLDIEIKINRAGSFRLNLFSHSADQFSNFLDNTQRNGVGVMYQTEFNNFGKFIRSLFMRKAKRQAAKLEEEQAMLEVGKVEINIKAPESQTEIKDRNGRK